MVTSKAVVGSSAISISALQERAMAIGRMYAQAPEVDGLTVVLGHDLEAGKVVLAGIRKVNGLDLEAVAVQ